MIWTKSRWSLLVRVRLHNWNTDTMYYVDFNQITGLFTNFSRLFQWSYLFDTEFVVGYNFFYCFLAQQHFITHSTWITNIFVWQDNWDIADLNHRPIWFILWWMCWFQSLCIKLPILPTLLAGIIHLPDHTQPKYIPITLPVQGIGSTAILEDETVPDQGNTKTIHHLWFREDHCPMSFDLKYIHFSGNTIPVLWPVSTLLDFISI